MKRTITLMSDFGLKDPFVAQMKGVIYSINDEVNIVDISHDIPAHLIREAAVTIGMSYSFFPQLTVHVCVVDPGVGSDRRPVIVAADNHYFVGPDNGIFSVILQNNRDAEVIHVTADHYFTKKESTTFHGRDIFAPVAAWLAKGVPITNFGEPVRDFAMLNLPLPQRPTKNSLEGEIVYIDGFGNAITNISMADFGNVSRLEIMTKARVLCKGKQVPLKPFYADVSDRGLYAIFNSNDLLELFVYRGSAAGEHDLHIGDSVGVIIQ